MTTTTYRTTVPLPQDADSRRDVVDLLRQYGTVDRIRPSGARWELEAPDLYVLAETVLSVQSEISWAFQTPPAIPRPREVRAK